MGYLVKIVFLIFIHPFQGCWTPGWGSPPDAGGPATGGLRIKAATYTR